MRAVSLPACGKTPTVLMVILESRYLSSREVGGICGSPSEIMMTCFWPASALRRPSYANSRLGVKSGMSPNIRRLMLCLMRAPSPTGDMGCTHSVLPDHEYSTMPARSRRERDSTAAWQTFLP